MRTGRAVVATMIVTSAFASSSAASRASAPVSRLAATTACGPRSAKTLASDRRARVYLSNGSVYGCAAGQGHSYRLGAGGSQIREERVGPVALAGVDVGYGLTSFGVDTGSAQVIVRRLDTGHQLRDLSATTAPLGPESYQSVGSIVVKPDSAVAWIGTAHSIIGRGDDVEVDRADRRGQAKLDSGTGIDSSSLRLSGSRLTWRDGGALRSGSLS